MQKYLLLLLMCLVGMIEAQAGIKVENVGTGSYILTFTNSADATYDWNSLLNSQNSPLGNVSEVTSLKIVTDNYELTESDMVKVTGNNQTQTSFSNLKVLDMGDAVLKNESSMTILANLKCATPKEDGTCTGLRNLTHFTFPRTTTAIPEEVFQNNKKIQEVIMLENVGGKPLQTISKSAFQGCTNLTNVVIPNGIVTIDDNAFQYCPFQSISLPNTLQYINYNAFSDCGELRSVTIPASVKDIGTSAFQKNFKMTDVYVLGDNVTIRNGAFNENATYNFSYTDDGDGIVEYEDWGTNNPSASPHPLRLHIPDTPNAKSRYINLCLQALNDPEMTDATMNKGPEGVVPILKKYGFNDSSIGTVMWKFTPSSYVVMDGKKYFKDGDGKFNLPGENGITNDYGGWRNFMLVATDIEEKIWYDGRLVESRWYTAVFPFDMSYNQVMTTFGAKTDVREFSYVNEHKNENGQTVRTVSFYDYPEIPDGDKNKPGWVKTGVPYMIHPGVRSVPVTRAGSSKPTYRTIAGVDVEKAKKEEKEGTPKTVTRNLIDGEKLNTKKGSKGSDLPIIEGTTYTFTGTYTLKDIPANSFYLGYEPPRWPLAFYVTTVVQPNKWNPYTSIVQKKTTSGDSNAKTMDLGFENIIEDDFGIATEVVNFVVQQNIQDNKVVYNLNGQVVRENNASLEGLSKGVYVVNGKKIVVR